MTDHRLSKDQHDRLVAKRRAYRASMRCRGVHVEVLSREAIWLHPKATTLWRAIKDRSDKMDCCACGEEALAAAAPFFAFMRRRPSWDSDVWAQPICTGCAKRADLRSAIVNWVGASLRNQGLFDHHISKVVLPAELDEVAS